MEHCLFCSVVAGDYPVKKIYEDDQILVFHDLVPQAPVHVLFIPKKHIRCADELTPGDAGLLSHLLLTIPKIAAEQGLDEGYRIVNNCGKNGHQTEFHLHFHLLGGRKMEWPPG